VRSWRGAESVGIGKGKQGRIRYALWVHELRSNEDSEWERGCSGSFKVSYIGKETTKADDAGSEADAGEAVDFSSNDYLSLSSSPDLRTRFLTHLHASPNILGTGGSRLLDGGTLAHAQLEDRLATFFAAPAALLYTSGYDANVGNGGATQDSR